MMPPPAPEIFSSCHFFKSPGRLFAAALAVVLPCPFAVSFSRNH
jgi:hypothetical protein